MKLASPVCPECRDRKCGNCIGYALNQATDIVEVCRCAHSVPLPGNPKATD